MRIRHYLIKIAFCDNCGYETRINYTDNAPKCKNCKIRMDIKKKSNEVDIDALTYKHSGLNWMNMMKGIKWVDLSKEDFSRLNDIVSELQPSLGETKFRV